MCGIFVCVSGCGVYTVLCGVYYILCVRCIFLSVCVLCVACLLVCVCACVSNIRMLFMYVNVHMHVTN